MARKKKEKVTYIDDGRTIADMSGLKGGSTGSRRPAGAPRPGFREVWETYWNAVKMMLLPMLVAVGAIVVIFLVITLLFYVMY